MNLVGKGLAANEYFNIIREMFEYAFLISHFFLFLLHLLISISLLIDVILGQIGITEIITSLFTNW